MDENVMKVLQLVQDGKINAAEAEKLINALTGKNAASTASATSAASSSMSSNYTGNGGTATATAPPPTEPYRESSSGSSSAHNLATGDLLQQIADDPSIPESDKLTVIINLTALLCAVLIIQPIPLADLVIMTPIQIAGVIAMSQVMGDPLGKNGAGDVVKSILAVVGGSLIAQQLMIAGVKTLVPFFGGIAIIPVVYGATYGLMAAARAVLDARRSNQHLSDDEIRRIKDEAERRAKSEKRDWSPSAIKRDLDMWRQKGEAFKQYEILFQDEQRRFIVLHEDTDLLTAQLVTLSDQKMGLERQVQMLDEQWKGELSDEARASIRQERGRVDHELAQISPQWSSKGVELERKRGEAAQIAERLQATLRNRFEHSYPYVGFAPGVLEELATIPYSQLRHIERQISLLQFDATKANFQNEPFRDLNGNEIRMVAVDSESRLYTISQGSKIIVVGVGTPDTELRDMDHLRNSAAPVVSSVRF